VARVVDAGDGNQGAEQPGVDGGGAGAARVEVQGEEADAEVEGFAGDFVAVDEGAPVSVDGDEAEGGGGAGEGAPVGGGGGGGGGGEVAVWLGRVGIGIWGFLVGGLGWFGGGGGGFLELGVGFGTAAAGSGSFFEAGIRGGLVVFFRYRWWGGGAFVGGSGDGCEVAVAPGFHGGGCGGNDVRCAGCLILLRHGEDRCEGLEGRQCADGGQAKV